MQTRRVLIIDDSTADQTRYRRLLAKGRAASYEVDQTTDGRSGIEHCQQFEPDCVILDYRLPDMDGLEVLNAIRADQALFDVPIVFLTGQGSEELAVDAMKAGSQDYILKDLVTTESLERAIDRAIASVTAERAERTRQGELEAFASLAAHDLRAPLRRIRQFSELIERRATDQLDERNRGYLRRIAVSAEQLSQTVEDLLIYAQSGALSPSGKVAVFDLGAVVADVLDTAQPLIDKTGARVTLGTFPEISGREGDVRLIIQNLVVNGLTYVDCAAPELSVASRPVQSGLSIDVTDNGIGIAPAMHEAIFAPLARLNPPSRYEGTGLGLAICKKLAERNGGRIDVSSTPGEGSVFSLVLPRAE